MPTPREPFTADQLHAAFEAFAWLGWTFAAAMADPLRARLVRARAAQMRTREFQRTHDRAWTTVRRLNPRTGQWCTQRVPTGWDAHSPALDLSTSPISPTTPPCPQ